jgi:plastocyanin
MKTKNPIYVVAALLALPATLAIPRTLEAQQTWKATAGAQSADMGNQAVAFLPNEMWIHVGDSITWTSASGDIHTVSFLIAGQPYADFTVGCPGFSPSGVNFNGSMCVSAPPLAMGQEFTVKFSAPGNYKLVCLVHTHMTGVIHVLARSATLPHDQTFYDKEAANQLHNLLTDTDPMKGIQALVLPNKNSVAAGVGEMASTAAGFQSLSVVRFLGGTIEIHAGETVEWSNLDPALPHTITFGIEPLNPGPPSSNVSVDADGALHATITSPGQSVHSGVIGAVPQNQSGVPQSPPAIPVMRITFTRPGTYEYKCALHDNLGMLGKVIVLP